MIKSLCSLLIPVLAFSVSASAMDIDIHASNYRSNGSQEFVLENVRLSTMPGQSWGRFQWNSQVNSFVLIDAGTMTPTATGLWDLFFDMNCSGNHGHTTWNLNGDGSCMSGEGRACRWTVGQQGDFVLSYTTGGRVTYTGRFTGAALSGKFANPDGSVRGCWSAAKINKMRFTSPVTRDPKTMMDSSGAR